MGGDDETERERRILRAAMLMELFRRAHRRGAVTARELHEGAARNVTAAHDPASVLTREQIVAAKRDCLRDAY